MLKQVKHDETVQYGEYKEECPHPDVSQGLINNYYLLMKHYNDHSNRN